ncbi:MAG: MBL fold metallo-hydrolase [Anaerolineae bacterium]|nr:MBL fold metallo-hydrolase [Anaerolineae bacterium]
MILRRLIVGRLHTNCYIVGCEETKEALVIDPGGDAPVILEAIRELKVAVPYIVLTHFHFDHVLAADPVRTQTEALLAIHEAEAELLANPPVLFRLFSPQGLHGIIADRLLHEGDVLQVGRLEVHVLHTPGHSPGSISLWLPQEKVVFCGDLLFREGVGRVDFPGGDQQALLQSIREKLFSLPYDTVVYPGHGPETVISHERHHNPWVGDGGAVSL